MVPEINSNIFYHLIYLQGSLHATWHRRDRTRCDNNTRLRSFSCTSWSCNFGFFGSSMRLATEECLFNRSWTPTTNSLASWRILLIVCDAIIYIYNMSKASFLQCAVRKCSLFCKFIIISSCSAIWTFAWRMQFTLRQRFNYRKYRRRSGEENESL